MQGSVRWFFAKLVFANQFISSKMRYNVANRSWLELVWIINFRNSIQKLFYHQADQPINLWTRGHIKGICYIYCVSSAILLWIIYKVWISYICWGTLLWRNMIWFKQQNINIHIEQKIKLHELTLLFTWFNELAGKNEKLIFKLYYND